jgi:hypothetical protein
MADPKDELIEYLIQSGRKGHAALILYSVAQLDRELVNLITLRMRKLRRLCVIGSFMEIRRR